MMKRYYAIVFLLSSVFGTICAQVETHYYEKGKSDVSIKRSARRNLKVNRMPSFDLASLLKEDAKKDTMGGFFRFGKGFDVSYTLGDGQWENVEGGRLWTMTFASKDALSLNFVFNDFHLPKGAQLYIENEDKTVSYGPVTEEATTENGVFLTDIIPGDQATITLFEPFGCKGQSSLTIKRVVHGYRCLDTERKEQSTRSYNSCPSVACYPEYDKESDAVALIMSSDGIGLLNGALVMATDYSYKGYLLTTYELVDTDGNGAISTDEIAEAENCMFKFRNKYKDCYSSYKENSCTYNQAYFRAAWNSSKFALLEIRGDLNQNSNLTWLGWDRSGAVPTSGACIHHQNLTDLRICLGQDDELSVFVFQDFSAPDWDIYFTIGGVSNKSHGAPLLDENKRLVAHNFGQAYYGNNPVSTVGFFGKLYRSWTGGSTNTSRLSNWLDPEGTGYVVMNSSRTMIISGADKIISSSNYSIRDLPSNMTVTWQLSDSYYNQNCLQQDIPSLNQCTITKDASHPMSYGVLTATIWKNGNIIRTVQKTISTGDGFDGTYFNGVSTVQVNLPSPLYVLPGTLVVITSPDLVSATVSQVGGNATPTSLTFDGTNGVLQVGMPNTSGVASVFSVATSGGNHYTLPITTTNNTGALMSVMQTGSLMEVLIIPQDSMRPGAEPESIKNNWILDVYNTSTGNKAYSSSVEGLNHTIETSSWKPGVYAVRVVKGETVLSEKVIIK